MAHGVYSDVGDQFVVFQSGSSLLVLSPFFFMLINKVDQKKSGTKVLLL